MRLLSLVFFGLLLVGCGGDSPATTGASESSRVTETFGRDLFDERVIGANPGCVTCHSLEEGVTLVGPSLYAVTSRVPSMSDAEYIRESIIDPDGHVVDGFSSGQMTAGWLEHLTTEQVDSLVEFLTE